MKTELFHIKSSQLMPALQLTAIVLLLTCGTTILAQQDSAASPRRSAELPEEIVVNGPVSLTRLRNEINRAEENFFAIFNELIDEPKFEVHCKLEKMYGSKLTYHQCSPNYYRIAMEEEAELILQRMGHTGVMTNGVGVSDLERNNAIFEEIVQEAINTSPEFVDAVQHFEDLKANYEEQRKLKFGIED